MISEKDFMNNCKYFILSLRLMRTIEFIYLLKSILQYKKYKLHFTEQNIIMLFALLSHVGEVSIYLPCLKRG